MVGSTKLVGTMKVSLSKFFLLTLPAMVLVSILPASFAANEIDVYGDSKLHSVEHEIKTLAEASQKDISYQEHQQILDKVSEKIVGSISDVSQLTTLAIWAYLNVHSDESDEGFINYDHVIRTAFSAAVFRIGKLATPASEGALLKVAHQVNIDGHVSEELCESMSKITKKAFLFGDRVYVRFQDPIFQKLPMAPEYATFRVALCEEIWKHWKSPVSGAAPLFAKASFVIDSDRQFTNIKVVPSYFGKEKNQAVALQFEEAARSALEKCAIKEKLPEGVKKVRVQADFYGR
jgi:hypothetical protein